MKQIRDKNSMKIKMNRNQESYDDPQNENMLYINVQKPPKRIKKVYSREDLNNDTYLTAHSGVKVVNSSNRSGLKDAMSRNDQISKSKSNSNFGNDAVKSSSIPSTINLLKNDRHMRKAIKSKKFNFIIL